MDRAYLNAEEGLAVCCWDAPGKDKIEDLFQKAGVSPVQIVEVDIFGSDCTCM